MWSIDELLMKLDKRHANALQWFIDNYNKKVSWPQKLSNGDLVCTKAKAIYKPAWSKYVLSVYETLSENYPDEEPVFRDDGSWYYNYYQEGFDPNDFETNYTNVGLNKCIQDKIPVGIMRQVNPKPKSIYHVLGIALPMGYSDGFFHFEGFNDEGDIIHVQ